jgi:hypothetical protein
MNIREDKMKPSNENNFLIEVTPEQLEELRNIYKYVDDEGYVELHYSPYWKTKPTPTKIEKEK